MFRKWRMLGLSFGLVLLLAFPATSRPLPENEEPGRVISVVAERFSFVPSRIKLQYGEVVELRIRSLDTNHGFSIPEADVNVIVPKRGKGDARILFRAKERGSFAFFCSKPCGAGHTMMRGLVIVE